MNHAALRPLVFVLALLLSLGLGDWPGAWRASGAHASESVSGDPSLTLTDPRLVVDEMAGYALSGQVSVQLSAPLVAAIDRGVTLTFVSEFQLVRTRWWWFDSEVYQHTRTARLTFHPLTRQFRVSVDGAKVQAFTDLTEALRAALALKGWRVMPEPIATEGLQARVRLQLDANALPKPLQVSALTDPQWKLDTGWVLTKGP